MARDVPILSAPTRLPRLLLMTSRVACEAAGRNLFETIRQAVDGGATGVILREKDLPPPVRREMGVEIASLLEPVGGTLIVAGDPEVAEAVGATRVHLASSDPVPQTANLTFGRSCHGIWEVLMAKEHAEYVTASPIFVSKSKPGYGPGLGITGLQSLVERAPSIPIFALGGIGPGLANPCISAGTFGVAVMGAVMSADDPARVVHELLAEIEQALSTSPASPLDNE